MPLVRFLPAEIETEVAAGTLIHEAALSAGLLTLDLPCGGQSICGLCVVEVAGANGKSREVMACQTRIAGDITVRIPDARDAAMRVLGDSHHLVSRELLPDAAHLSPLCHAVRLTVPLPSIEEHYSDWSRVVRELCRGKGAGPVSAPLPVLQTLAAALRAQDGKVTLLVQETPAGLEVLEIEAGHGARRVLGLALDIGTTTIAAQLVDLESGRVLSTRTSYNAQIRRGADIISRIDYARTGERLSELRALVLDTINTLITQMQNDQMQNDQMENDVKVEARDIRAAFVAGNTTMIHLLLGLAPRHIRESPYIPTVTAVPGLTAAAVGFEIHPGAVVECAPGVGSYVGGDITAGLLCTELATNHQDVFLFLDIGTNGEIVIGNAEWRVACACSAGPAFEGSGIRCGMRATEGAIEHVEIAPGGALRYRVVGGGKPAGICGSGLISLLGEMLKRGIVDQAGRLHSDDSRGFLVESAERTATREDLVIGGADLENLVRTKAAIYAACARVLESVGLDWKALERVYIAGGFGRYIQIADAVRIGMLPDLPHEKFRYIGNAALTGAYMALLSREHRDRLTEIAARTTYVDLSSDPRYMDSYVQAMFLPHTDGSRFPTVARELANIGRN